jgi:hypothetical protein
MFDSYLESINASEVIGRRVEHLYGKLTALVPAQHVPYVFISNFLDNENNLAWQSLWFYGPEFCSEFRDFQLEEKFDWVRIPQVRRWEITCENFDMISATTNSRFALKWTIGGVTGALTAVGANCDHLLHFLRETVLPASLKGADSGEPTTSLE